VFHRRRLRQVEQSRLAAQPIRGRLHRRGVDRNGMAARLEVLHQLQPVAVRAAVGDRGKRAMQLGHAEIGGRQQPQRRHAGVAEVWQGWCMGWWRGGSGGARGWATGVWGGGGGSGLGGSLRWGESIWAKSSSGGIGWA